MRILILLILTFLSLNATSQTSDEIEMIVLVNKVRTNPQSLIPAVEDYIKSITELINHKGNFTLKSNPNKNINAEVISEAKKLIAFLRTAKSVNTLELSLVLYPITKSHAQYLDSINQLKHTGPNGEPFANRFKNTGLMCGENCVISSSAINGLILLLIDLGNKDKGHRDNIFNPKYTQIAVGKFGNTWVQDFAY
jgi:uncharacterized protein YkwD